MNRAHPQSRTTQALAVTSLVLLSVMVALTFATGVAQEPFEAVRPLEDYRAALRSGAPTLERILAVDSLFISAYAGFFVTLGKVAGSAGTRDLLRLGTLALLTTAALDIVEDQHLFALARTVAQGEELTLATLRAQHVLSQTKFHVSYVGLALFGLGLPRRDTLERAFALAVGLPIPVLGAALWIAPPALVMPLSVARWLGFMMGFAFAIALLRRAPRLTPSRVGAGGAHGYDSGAPA